MNQLCVDLNNTMKLTAYDVIMDTEFYWVLDNSPIKATDEWEICNRSEAHKRKSYYDFAKLKLPNDYMARRYCIIYPAPTMQELWESLPDSISGDNQTYFKRIENGLIGYFF